MVAAVAVPVTIKLTPFYASVRAFVRRLEQAGARGVTVFNRRAELETWLSDKGYRSSAEARGVLDQHSSPDPHAWERLNYIQLLDGWRPRAP